MGVAGDIASDLSVHVEDLDQLVFGLALTGLAGGASSCEGNKADKPTRLRVVSQRDD